MMKDVFMIIDSWQSKFNILRDHQYLRQVALTFSVSMVIVWAILGFDSGVEMLENWMKALPNLINGVISLPEWVAFGYEVYGKSFHFSSFVIYGLLFVGLSKHLDSLDIKHSRNSLYSAFLVLLNISVFEWFYMATFAHFQMHRNLVEWFVTDFWFLQQFLLLLILGILTVVALWIDSHTINNGEVVGRNFKFFPDKKMVVLSCLLLGAVLLWVYYPFSVTTITINGWTNSNLFPQTHYAYVDATLYVQNDVLHSLNLITKALFALCQLFIIKGFNKELRVEQSC